jgi:uncharacterized glyoxalase superfamily protein PhnB
VIEQPQDHEAVDNADNAGGAPVGAPELVFDQVNLVVADIDAPARFYRDLGADVPEVGAGFSYPTSEAVDEAYLAATAAGYPGRQPPYHAFWGTRYAIVADPDGNDVGLMGPVDPARRYVPELTS